MSENRDDATGPAVGRAPRLGRLLTVDEAAAFLNVPVRFIRRLAYERRIPVVRLGRHIRLAETDLDALVRPGRSQDIPAAGPRNHPVVASQGS